MEEDQTLRALEAMAVDDLQWLGPGFESWLEERKFPLMQMYKEWGENERIAFARRAELMRIDDIIPNLLAEMQPHLPEYLEEQQQGGPKYRDVNIVSRLVYIGALPVQALEGNLQLSQIVAWSTNIISGVSDRKQLDVDMMQAFVDAKFGYDQLVGCGALRAAVIASLEPLASRRKVVLSAMFSLSRMVGIKGSSFSGIVWKSPAGVEYECVPCPLTGAPLYVKDAEALEREIRETTRVDVTIIPGSILLYELVAAIIALRTVTWNMTKLELGVIPGGHAKYEGFWSGPLREKSLNVVLEKLPGWSADYPPPQNLAGAERMPEYLAYLLYKVEQEKLGLQLPPESAVELWAMSRLKRGMEDACKIWASVKTFEGFYAAVKAAKALPVTSLNSACVQAETRRAVENRNTMMTAMLGSSTANARHFEPRNANAIAKCATLIRWFRAAGYPKPSRVDYTGVDSGPGTTALRAWNAAVDIRTYGGARHKMNTEPFALWDVSQGYPDKGGFLFDMSLPEGAKDLVVWSDQKVAMLTRAGYDAGVLQFYPTGESKVRHVVVGDTATIELPHHWGEIPKLYRHVTILAPGRAHSPEMFICFSGRRQIPATSEEVTAAVGQMYLAMMHKAALMGIANTFREYVYGVGHPTVLTQKISQYVGGQIYVECAKLLAHGDYETPGLYDWKGLVGEAKHVVGDEGLEIMPDLAELANSMRLDEEQIALRAIEDKAFERGLKRRSAEVEKPPTTPPASGEGHKRRRSLSGEK
jgi:hypothetical protein